MTRRISAYMYELEEDTREARLRSFTWNSSVKFMDINSMGCTPRDD